MELRPKSPEERYGPALEKAQRELRGRDPHVISEWAGVHFRPDPGPSSDDGQGAAPRGTFTVPFLTETYYVDFPAGIVTDDASSQPPIFLRLVILHYLQTASGVPLADRWIAFRELPGGLGYNTVFDARVNQRIAGVFGTRLEAFIQAAEAFGGVPLSVGDAAFAFNAFPRLRVAVVLYLGDEELPATANLIFDGAAGHYLPTEDLVVMGETIASRLTKYQPPA